MQPTYTKYRFVVSNHGYHKNIGNSSDCSLTLETNQTVENEDVVGRELEVLLRHGIIKHFGAVISSISSVVFTWSEKIVDEKTIKPTAIQITYTSTFSPLSNEEIAEIVERHSD